MYNFEKLAGYKFSLNCVEELKNRFPDQIVGIKDSTYNIYDKYKKNDLSILVGSEEKLLSGLKVGCSGAITATCNVTSKIARKVVKKVVSGEEKEVKINKENLSDFLGVPKFKSGELETENRVGIVTGLAWTEYGGEILKIETATMPGKGRMQITGKLGDVMQESVKAAKSFVRSKCLEYGIIPPLFEKKDFHIHVPEGATPKDGPSAGIGMVTSIVSSITNIPVKRDVAMTGEVTLTGQVLPIGGLKEKLIAAHRAGIKEVLIPKENEKDLVDMPKKIIDEIKITPVEYADEVLKIALTKELKKTEWVEVDISKKDDKSQASIQ